MIQPITYYDQRRKRNGQIGEIRREPSGRYDRKSEHPEFVIYFVQLEGHKLTKIGRTQNMRERIRSYEAGSGMEARTVAQIVVGSRDHSIKLEAELMALMRARGYSVTRREWFEIPDGAIANIVLALCDATAIPVTSVRGLPEYDEGRPEWSVFKADAASRYAAHMLRKRKRTKTRAA